MKKIILILCLFVFLSPFCAAAQAGDYVVLLHGIGRTKSSMSSLEGYLSGKGYEVINIDYQSRESAIESLIEDIGKVLKDKRTDPSKKTHFVGHSMGGLITRGYIKKHRPENLGRVVMLGTPNQGSEVADFMAGNFLFKDFYGPAGQQLVTDQSKFESLYGQVDYDLGIIAGTRSIDPVSSFIIPGKDDGKVSVERTKLTGMKDYIVIGATHTFMAGNDTVERQVEHFIAHGEFEHEAKTPLTVEQFKALLPESDSPELDLAGFIALKESGHAVTVLDVRSKESFSR